MPDAPTPLDLDAIRVRADARRDYADERPESLHDPEHYAALADESAADVPALVAEVERLRAEATRPAPAWDEETVLRDIHVALVREGVVEDGIDAADAAKAALAVVREHLPVKPRREAFVEAMLGSDIITDDLRAEASAQGSTQREPFLCFADAVLDLWSGRSEAEVKAEAWDEGAIFGIRNQHGTVDVYIRDAIERHNHYRLAAEGGADRG